MADSVGNPALEEILRLLRKDHSLPEDTDEAYFELCQVSECLTHLYRRKMQLQRKHGMVPEARQQFPEPPPRGQLQLQSRNSLPQPANCCDHDTAMSPRDSLKMQSRGSCEDLRKLKIIDGDEGGPPEQQPASIPEDKVVLLSSAEEADEDCRESGGDVSSAEEASKGPVVAMPGKASHPPIARPRKANQEEGAPTVKQQILRPVKSGGSSAKPAAKLVLDKLPHHGVLTKLPQESPPPSTKAPATLPSTRATSSSGLSSHLASPSPSPTHHHAGTLSSPPLPTCISPPAELAITRHVPSATAGYDRMYPAASPDSSCSNQSVLIPKIKFPESGMTFLHSKINQIETINGISEAITGGGMKINYASFNSDTTVHDSTFSAKGKYTEGFIAGSNNSSMFRKVEMRSSMGTFPTK